MIKSGDSVARTEGDYDKAIASAKKMLVLAKRHGYKKGEVDCQILIGNALWNKGDSKNALKLFHLLEKDPFVKQRQEYLANVYIETGQSYYAVQLFDLAIQYHKKGIGILNRPGIVSTQKKKSLLVYSFGSLAYLFEENKLVDSAFVYHYRLLKMNNTPINLLNLANLHMQTGQRMDSAKHYVTRAEKMLGSKTYPAQQRGLYHKIYGIYLHKTGKYTDAEQHLKKALDMALNLKRHKAIVSSYKALTTFYDDISDEKNKLYYLERFAHFNDSIEAVRMHNTSFAVADILSDSESKLAQESRKSYWALTLSSVLAVTLGIVTILYIRNKKQAKLNELDVRETPADAIPSPESEIDYEDVIAAAKSNDPAFLTKFERSFTEFYRNLTKAPLT